MSVVSATDEKKNQSPLLLVVGFVALWLLLAYVGGWALPVVIIAVVVMVMIHEFGHFATAKLSGMRATDFFVGFGPVLWSTKRGDTRYGVRALLLGGYVKVPGMTWTEEVPTEYEATTYRAATYPRKVIFASAGSFMHLVMALVLAWASLSFLGRIDPSHVGISSLSQWSNVATTPAQRAGFEPGDRVLTIDGKSITSETGLVDAIHHSVGQSLSVVVVRNGRDVTLHVTPVDGRRVEIDGSTLAPANGPAVGDIGIGIEEQNVKESPLLAIGTSFSYVGDTVRAAVDAMVHVFSPSSFSSLLHQVSNAKAANNVKNQDSRPESIVGVVRIAVQGANAGGQVFLSILISLNIFIGILNMLPMLPLDGGHVAIATYERIRTRRRTSPYHADINKLSPVVYLFVAVLLVLFVSTLYLDIAHPISNPFQ